MCVGVYTCMLQKPIFPLYIVGPMILYIIDWIISLRQKALLLKIEAAEALPSREFLQIIYIDLLLVRQEYTQYPGVRHFQTAKIAGNRIA